MKKIVFSILTIISASNAFTQARPNVYQDICIGQVDSGYHQPQTWVTQVFPIANKATILTGYASLNGSNYAHPYHHNADTTSGFDGFVHKVDSLGIIEWTRFFGGSGSDFINNVTPNPMGGFIGVGSTTSSDGDVHGYRPSTYPAYGSTTVPAKDAYVISFNDSGDTLWTKTFGTYGQEEAMGVAATLDGGFIFCGNIDSTGEHGHGWHASYYTDYRGSLRAPDGWIVKFDAGGDTVWTRTIGGGGVDAFRRIIATSDSGYLAIGHSNTISSMHHGNDDVWVVKLDKNGAIEWENLYGGSGADVGYNVIELADKSGYALLNSTRSVDGDVVDSKPGGSFDIWLLVIDNSGNITRSRCYGSTGHDFPGNIIEAFEGGFLFTADVSRADEDVDSVYNNSSDGWIVKTDTAGNIVWERNIGSNSYDGSGVYISLLADGTMIGSIGQTHADVTPSADKTCSAVGTGLSWVFWLDPCPSYTYKTVTICQGDHYTFGTQTISDAGIYWETLTMESGCDSLIQLTVMIDSITTPTITATGNTLSTGIYSSYQWLDGSNDPISGATAQTYDAATAGSYRVVVTNENGCSDTSLVYNHTPSSLHEPALFSTMELYPNPAREVVNIEIPQLTGKATIELTNVEGRIMATQSLSTLKAQLSIDQLPSGVYFIKIITEEGVAVRKIVKE